jgi:hypothetical protein
MKANNNSLILGAVVAGAGLYFLFNSGDSVTAPAPGASPALPGSKPTTPKPTPAPAPGTPPPPTPKPAPVTTTPVGEAKYVFVNSFLGEGIFYGVGNTKSSTNGYGLERIVTLKNGEFVGALTGKRANGMIQCYIGYGGKVYYYWIEEKQTIIFSKAGYEDYLKTDGYPMRSGTISLITLFFKGKGK